ncbi:MAG: hypothetical protein QOJ29_2501, partial [Thermoleophilaceae bacterium]|nr:hypothetical protein [Thermoleophilaceae bacterium]
MAEDLVRIVPDEDGREGDLPA